MLENTVMSSMSEKYVLAAAAETSGDLPASASLWVIK